MKGRGKRINYAEVESDEDLDDQQKQLERIKRDGNGRRKGGDTYGTTQGGQRKKRKTTRNSKQLGGAGGEPEYNSKLLLDLPFDLFVEVCSHFDGKDLLALAQVNKGIRHILLSKEARSIWSALRRKLGYALPNGMKEVGFALMVHSQKCQVCGKAVADQNLTVFLRSRFCRKCFKAHTISSKGLKKAWPDLHSLAAQCVRYVDHKYLVSDLEVVNEKLKELEEEDEIADSLLQNLRCKGSSTRTRQSNIKIEDVDAARVERFVEEKQEWVKVEQGISHGVVTNRTRLEEEQWEEEEARWTAIEAAQDLVIVELKSDHGWDEKEAEYLRDSFELAPKETIEQNPDAWTECRQLIRKKIDDAATKLNKALALDHRRSLLQPYYDQLKLQEDDRRDDRRGVFPDFWAFLQFKSIRPLRKPEDATIDDNIWQGLDSDIAEDLDKYEEKGRVEAIRCILATNQGLSSTSSLSTDPADYSESTYDEDFFLRMTSLFFDRSYRTYPRTSAKPYPLAVRDTYHQDLSNLESGISPRQILIIRSMIEAAGLDPETADRDDFNVLESNFVWLNDPRVARRGKKYSWSSLLSEALRRGPGKRKIAQGEGFEFEYRPQDEDQVQDSRFLDSDEEDEEEESEGEEGSGEEEGESAEEEEDGSENGDDNSDEEEE